MSIFDKRTNYKPFEYPEVNHYIDMMNKTFWVHSEVDFTADIQDFKTNLNSQEKEVLKRSLLSISQIEVGVKTFWGNLYNMFPKPEFNGLGSTFAESEYRHSEAYSKLLDVLGYNNEFKNLLEVDVFKKKLHQIEQVLNINEPVTKTLYFTLLLENTSLFSLFANVLSFTRFSGLMKNVANIIAWTSVDEQVHSEAGIYIINTVQKESLAIRESLKLNEVLHHNFIKKMMGIEEELLDWIYEKGELSFFTKQDVLNFMYKRIDIALEKIGLSTIYNVQDEDLKPMLWFEEEVFAGSLDDFFAKRPVDYTKHDKSININDLF